MTREALLARTFVEIADTPAAEFDQDVPLSLLCHRSVEVLDVASCGAMVAGEGAITVPAWSAPMARTLALLELRYHEGPSLDCCRTRRALVNQSLMPAETPWPRWGAAGLAAGYETVHALPLLGRDEAVGAVVLYQVDRHPIDAADLIVGQALADATTIAIQQQRAALDAKTLVHQLYQALSSRVIVEQAKGIVAARSSLTLEAAFDRIRSFARSHSERIDALARRIVDGHLAVLALDDERNSSKRRR